MMFTGRKKPANAQRSGGQRKRDRNNEVNDFILIL